MKLQLFVVKVLKFCKSLYFTKTFQYLKSHNFGRVVILQQNHAAVQKWEKKYWEFW